MKVYTLLIKDNLVYVLKYLDYANDRVKYFICVINIVVIFCKNILISNSEDCQLII